MTGLLDEQQRQKLLELARETLSQKISQQGGQERETGLPVEPDDPAFSVHAATFVTLKIAGKLRGCIGNLQPVGSLWRGVRDNALNAAFNDHRFSPLSAKELSEVKLDISILSEAKPLAYRDAEDLLGKLQPGIDGVIMKSGGRSSTFLPQVWQQIGTPALFLEHLCIKAGLAGDSWRHNKPDIYTYQVQSFGEDK